MNDKPAPLRLEVSLNPSLARAVKAARAPASARIVADVADLLRDLGIARQPTVELDESDEQSPPIALVVEGRRCPFPTTTIADAVAYVQRTSNVAAGADAALESIRKGNCADSEQIAEVIAFVCRAAISAHSRILAAADEDPARRAALGLGMSVARSGDAADDEVSGAADPVERFIAASAGETIDVHIDRAALRLLTTEFVRDDMFPFARDGLFAELGVPLPPFRFRPDPSLHAGAFAFRINAVRTPPRMGLTPGTILVNDTPERLRLQNFDAVPTLNPATAQPGSIVDKKHDEVLTSAGLTTWTPAGYLILCLAAEVRRNAHALMTCAVADRLSERLGWAFPVLDAAARSHVGTDRLAQVLRELLLEGIPIRNLRRIVELMLRYQTGGAGNGRPDLVGFVRAGLADLIANKLSRGTGTIVVYLLDPDLERQLADATDADDAPAERLSAALREELAALPPTASLPALLTHRDVRQRLAELLRPEFPRTRVVSYDDLPPTHNVQPVARVGSS